MTRSIRSLIIVVTVGAMVLLLAACGNTTSSSNEANESNETGETSEVSEAVASPEATEIVAAEATSEASEMPMAEATSEATTEVMTEDSVDNGADEASEMPMAEATTEATEMVESTEMPMAEATTEVMSEDSADNGADEASEMPMAETSTTCALLNLNTATQDELMNTLPDFSDTLASTVIKNRPYDSIEQFSSDMSKSADDTQISAWETYLYVPVDPNNSDTATLQQLPGVDESIASTLIDARPYADQQAFLDKLGSLVSAEQLAQADCYLGE